MTLRRVIFRLLLAGSVVLPLAARAEGAGAFFSRGANASKWGGYAHAALADLTPYLAGFAAGLFLLSLALLFCEARPLVRVRHRFRALPRFQQVLLVLSIGVMTASAQKSGTHEASVALPVPAALNAVDGEEEDFLATNIFPATNVFAITSFAVDRARCEVSFEASWTSTFFDSVDSRNVDLFSSTNLLERRWTPLAAFAMPTGTNACAFVVTSNDVDVSSRPQFLDTFAGLGFYRLGLDVDSDGDGLTDAYETLSSFTDPLDADFDGDGLCDADELAAGTDPFDGDTDLDGITDGEEVAHFEVIAPDDVMLPEFDLQDATNLLAGVRSRISAQFPVVLPFAFTGGGIVHTNATVDLDGVVAFHPILTPAPLTLSSQNVNLLTLPRFPNHTVVAPYWDALYASPTATPAARILMDDVVAWDGRRYWVVEYENIRLQAERSAEGQVATFQVAVCEDEPSTIYVRYVHLASVFDGTSATIGAQLPGGACVLQLSFDAPFAVTDGTVVAYRFCAGTDPLTAEDSDHDGVPDGREVQLGTDPMNADSDRDGMTDGWEVENRLDPTSAMGEDGADGDPDGDGLPNIDEYQNDCDPQSADTDGDGVQDGVEVGQGSDPTEDSDGGTASSQDAFRELTFNINGDYAAWEMSILGLGPDDMRMRRISMGAPNALQNVTMRLRKGNSYRLSMWWLNSDGHTNPCWYCWQAKIDGKPSAMSYSNYATTRLSGNEVVVGSGWIAENASGLLTTHVHMRDSDENGSGGGNVAQGLTATLYVLGNPKLIPDYNRDGKIDDVDEAAYDADETPFRFWVNDDNDTGDVNDSANDRPGSGANGQDAVVNGCGDLLDFTPVLVDLSDVFPPGTPSEIKARFSWKLKSSVVNVIWTPLSAANAGDFLRTDCGAAFGTGLAQDATSASVVSLANGATLPDEFVSRMTANGDQGIVLVEGRAAGSGLEVQGFCDSNSTATVEGELDIRVSPVKDMYRFGSLRGAESSASFAVALPGLPSNLMTRGKDLDIFFTHGFNVSESDAHAWGAEVFKRLWQSGSNARFWMVTWAGDYNWIGSAFNGLHYQQDVYQALKTGVAFKAFVEAAQPVAAKRVVMTQSLGNMVACEALRQGLNVGKYFMFNAAVPSEAIDGTLQDADAATRAKYVPSDWDGYDPRSWASNWHKWFATDANDTRSQLGWVNRYAAALDRASEVYNYYSTGDEVFYETANPPWLLEGVLDSTANYAWQKQETSKGSRALAGTAYGGWGFHSWRIAGFDYTYSATEANAMVAAGSITNNPVFNRGYEPMFATNATPDEVMYALAKYVPAVSSAVGGRQVLSDDGDAADLNDVRFRSGWPTDSHGSSWRHSDMKDVAYFFVWPLYHELVNEKGNLK